ncbi:MAG: lipopolysaccharide heptosyltransferase II [Sedimentisphaerales bacterium]|nr:lipopolysaccharide heptosyltransferase II [Sedimentisphaerales bacterium]
MRDTKHRMQNDKFDILVWLPSPMGDAILSTPALRAIRRRFGSSKITFFANQVVRSVLTPCDFNDGWIEPARNLIAIAAQLKAHKFTHAILFKNSFAAALAVFLAGIPRRIGYAREMRGPLLTEKLYPPRLPNGKFKPASMLDYYLAIAARLGAETTDRRVELQMDANDKRSLWAKLPELADHEGPIAVLVPGGAFGPSKCWPSEYFAETADWLIDNYNAAIVISVAPDLLEKETAGRIVDLSRHKLINLGDRPVNLGELKALYSAAALVIANDTGPRHIAIALNRRLITLFGPNDPAWTETDYEDEIQIVGNVPCAPCAKPTCKKPQHLCMESITPQTVCLAAKELLDDRRNHPVIFTQPGFEKACESFFVNPEYKPALSKLGLTSIDAVFSFHAGESLNKQNLPVFRTRLQFQLEEPQSKSPTTAFLKRYEKPPIFVQLKNWLAHHRRKSCAACEFEPIRELSAAGINTPNVIAYGEQWSALFENKSFIITEKTPDAEALERRLPDCFNAPHTPQNLNLRRTFIAQLAAFVNKFHQTGYRHRDLYLSHIFHSDDGRFYLIDLARAFIPKILRRRFQIKDIAQIHYSSPAKYFSASDRLRFYLAYAGRNKLTNNDKQLLRQVMARARQMARHDRRHGRNVPFAR